MLFIPAYRLVQDMLAAKRDLEFPGMLRKLDNFDRFRSAPKWGRCGRFSKTILIRG